MYQLQWACSTHNFKASLLWHCTHVAAAWLPNIYVDVDLQIWAMYIWSCVHTHVYVARMCETVERHLEHIISEIFTVQYINVAYLLLCTVASYLSINWPNKISICSYYHIASLKFSRNKFYDLINFLEKAIFVMKNFVDKLASTHSYVCIVT